MCYTAGLLLVAVCGAGLGLLYVAVIPVLAPPLAFVSARGRARSLISSSRAAGADGDQPGLTPDDVHVRQVRRPTWYTRSVTTVMTAKARSSCRGRLP